MLVLFRKVSTCWLIHHALEKWFDRSTKHQTHRAQRQRASFWRPHMRVSQWSLFVIQIHLWRMWMLLSQRTTRVGVAQATLEILKEVIVQVYSLRIDSRVFLPILFFHQKLWVRQNTYLERQFGITLSLVRLDCCLVAQSTARALVEVGHSKDWLAKEEQYSLRATDLL